MERSVKWKRGLNEEMKVYFEVEEHTREKRTGSSSTNNLFFID